MLGVSAEVGGVSADGIFETVYVHLRRRQSQNLPKPDAVLMHPRDWESLVMRREDYMTWATTANGDQVMGVSILRSADQPQGSLGFVFNEGIRRVT